VSENPLELKPKTKDTNKRSEPHLVHKKIKRHDKEQEEGFLLLNFARQ
jgi:hypothetical protein